MVIELILSVATGALFFLPWFGFLGKTYSGLEIYPRMKELMQPSEYWWAAYTFLLLYVIPLLAIICLILFIAMRRNALHTSFISLCDATLILLIVLVLTGAYAMSGFEDFGQGLITMITGMGIIFWVMLALSVVGLIFAAVSRAMRKPPLISAPQDTPSA